MFYYYKEYSLLDKYFKVTLVRSLIGRLPKHRVTVIGLGLRKINSYRILKCNNSVIGMIKKVNYLLKVEECENENVFK